MKKTAYISGFLIIIHILFFNPVLTEAAKLPSGSTIAGISVEGLNDSEVIEKLEAEIDAWKTGEPLSLQGEHELYLIPRSAAHFDVERTMNQLKEKTKRQMKNFFIKPKNIHIPLIVHVDKNVEEIKLLAEATHIDNKKTMLHIKKVFKELGENEASIVYDDEAEINRDVIAETNITIPSKQMSPTVLNYAIDELNGQTIPSQQPFSFAEAIEFPEKLTNSTLELSFLASTMYSLILQTNFDVITRESDERLTDYMEIGTDVYIEPDKDKDLIVYNPNESSFEIKVEKSDDGLKMALLSFPLEQTYEYEIKNKKEIEQHTLYRYSNDLEVNERKTIEEGKKGVTAKIYRHHYDQFNILIESELISTEFLLPEPTIILVSTEEDIPEAELDHTDGDENEFTPERMYDAFIEVIDEEKHTTIPTLDEAITMLETELLEAIIASELAQLTKEEKLAYVQKMTEENLNRLKAEFDKYSPLLSTEFYDFIKQLISISEQLEKNQSDSTEKEIIEVSKQFKEFLTYLDNPLYKEFLQSLLQNKKENEA